MADTNSDVVQGVPGQPGQPYDAAAPDGSMTGPWRKLASGPCDVATGRLSGDDFPSGGPWKQC